MQTILITFLIELGRRALGFLLKLFESLMEQKITQYVLRTKTAGPKPVPLPEPTPSAPAVTTPVSKPYSNDIKDAHPYLAECYLKIKAEFEQLYPEYTLGLTFVWRSKEYQNELYQRGRRGIAGEQIVTDKDGINKLSKHNYTPSTALDIVIRKGKEAIWAVPEYAKLTPIINKYKLVHGLEWHTFKDPQHIELAPDFE